MVQHNSFTCYKNKICVKHEVKQSHQCVCWIDVGKKGFKISTSQEWAKVWQRVDILQIQVASQRGFSTSWCINSNRRCKYLCRWLWQTDKAALFDISPSVLAQCASWRRKMSKIGVILRYFGKKTHLKAMSAIDQRN